MPESSGQQPDPTNVPTQPPAPPTLSKKRYHRKVIKICAEDSPNVRYALWEIAQGRTPSNREIVPGVLSWEEYQDRRKTWDKIRQTIGLDAEFYEGSELLMYPPDWLSRAEEAYRQLLSGYCPVLSDGPAMADALPPRRIPLRRRARGLGCDPAEGGDKSTWAVADEWGIMRLLSLKTPDTTIIINHTLALMNEYGIPASRVCFDRGGGGKQHADELRRKGKAVRTVAFGETVALPVQPNKVQFEDKKETAEERYQFKNRRAQLYGELRQILRPDGGLYSNHSDLAKVLIGGVNRYGLPPDPELRSQLAPIPLKYDREGRMILLPKHSGKADPEGDDSNSNEMTLTKLIGHSPDEADAITLAIHAMLHRDTSKVVVGAVY